MRYFLVAYASSAGWLLWDALGGKQVQQQGCRNGTGQTFEVVIDVFVMKSWQKFFNDVRECHVLSSRQVLVLQ